MIGRQIFTTTSAFLNQIEKNRKKISNNTGSSLNRDQLQRAFPLYKRAEINDSNVNEVTRDGVEQKSLRNLSRAL